MAVGLEQNRLAILLAVLHRHGGLQMADQDVFVNVVGGVKVTETSADLALLLAMVSIYGGQVTHYSGTLSPVLFGTGYTSQQRWWAMSLAMALIWAVISFAVGIPYWGLLGLL